MYRSITKIDHYKYLTKKLAVHAYLKIIYFQKFRLIISKLFPNYYKKYSDMLNMKALVGI